MVRLKGWLEEREDDRIFGFNSKMVRLKDLFHDEVCRAWSLFQFQNGSIKSKKHRSTAVMILVSIPKWFD